MSFLTFIVLGTALAPTVLGSIVLAQQDPLSTATPRLGGTSSAPVKIGSCAHSEKTVESLDTSLNTGSVTNAVYELGKAPAIYTAVQNSCTTQPPYTSYVVQYRTYIPVDHIGGPTPCFVGPLAVSDLNYLGDKSSYSDGFRIKQTTFVTIGKSNSSNTPPSKAAGLTVNFARPSPVNGNISNADFDYRLRDCLYLNNFDYASLDNVRMTAVNGAGFSQLRFQGLGNDLLSQKLVVFDGISRQRSM